MSRRQALTAIIQYRHAGETNNKPFHNRPGGVQGGAAHCSSWVRARTERFFAVPSIQVPPSPGLADWDFKTSPTKKKKALLAESTKEVQDVENRAGLGRSEEATLGDRRSENTVTPMAFRRMIQGSKINGVRGGGQRKHTHTSDTIWVCPGE